MTNDFFKKLFLTSAAIVLATPSYAKTTKRITQLPKVTVVATTEKTVDGYKTNSISSSTRTNTRLLDTPQAVSVVTQEQMQDQNITNMEEAARYVPGVVIQQGEANRDALTFRGNGSSADFYVDGARDDAEYLRDFYNIERVEFLKGPSAMAFGRGNAGGLVNRVSKTADGKRTRRLILSGGSFENRRAAIDIGDKVNDKLAVRLNTMYEKSGTFRQYGDLERYGFNPTATMSLSDNTELKVGYEHFRDKRFNDRGIPSSRGFTYKTSSETFFGNPTQNLAEVEVNSVYGTLTHDFSDNLQIKNFTKFTDYNKFYQNVYVNGAVSGSGTIALAAYNKETDRANFTNQTDLTAKFNTGSVKHTALIGTEITRQKSKSLRLDGTFDGSSSVSVTSPLSFTPVRYTSTAINNDSQVNVLATYLQDQIDINKYLQFTLGARLERFEIDLDDHKTNRKYNRTDNLFSPRAGIVVKPQDNLSLYTSYSMSYLPSAGDQFSSIDATTNNLKPEQFQNYEIGFKWDVTPRLNFSTAIYQLDRTNTKAVDPNNTSRYILSGATRTRGLELEATGKITDKWQVIGGYTYQDAYVVNPYNTSLTGSAIRKGNQAQLAPRNKFSLWNKYDLTNKFAFALGAISQSSQFASADNSVRLKGFTRFDLAGYYKINPSYRLQVNVENIFDNGYMLTAHNNNNLQPGSTRAFKLSLIANF